MINKLSCSSQAAVPGSTWLLSSMVQEVLSIMAEETSDDASTSLKRSSASLASITDKLELELFCSRPGLGSSSVLDVTVVNVSF